MDSVTRRQSLKIFLGGLLHAAGSVVVATCVVPARAEEGPAPTEDSGVDLLQRADRVAEQAPQDDGEGTEPCAFLNGAFRNTGFANGGFHNTGFRNAGFHNGGFRNGSSSAGGFRNAGFANGGSGGGFRNSGFANGGFRN